MSSATMIVMPQSCRRPETNGFSVPLGGGNFSLSVGISLDDAPMNAAATPAAPLVQVPICKRANHTHNNARPNASWPTRKPNATIKTPFAVNSMCAMTMPRNHSTAEGGMNPTAQPTVICKTPRNNVQRLMLALRLSRSPVIRFPLTIRGAKQVAQGGREAQRVQSGRDHFDCREIGFDSASIAGQKRRTFDRGMSADEEVRQNT